VLVAEPAEANQVLEELVDLVVVEMVEQMPQEPLRLLIPAVVVGDRVV
jgi:hypothetical protein